MKRFFRHFAFAAFGVSILCLALGVAMLIWTATAMKWISYGFGAVMILSGILQIASYLTGERVGLLRKLLSSPALSLRWRAPGSCSRRALRSRSCALRSS